MARGLKLAIAAGLLLLPLCAQQDRPVRFFPNDPTGACSVITPLVNNWVLGRLWQCFGASGVGGGTWVLVSGGSSAITSLTGDGTASGPGPAALTLAASGVSAGTYGSGTQTPRIVVDLKGRVTSATNTPIVGLSLSGTLAAIPGTCTAGLALYQATDQPAGLQLYGCSSTNTWTRVPYASGASNPATCSVPQIFFNTAASAGSNLQLCTSTNTWTQVSGSGTSYTGGVGINIAGGIISNTGPTSIQIQQTLFNTVTLSSSATCTFIGTTSPAAALQAGEVLYFVPNNACAGAATITIGANASTSIFGPNGSSSAGSSCFVGSGQTALGIIYSGSAFNVTSGCNSSGGAGGARSRAMLSSGGNANGSGGNAGGFYFDTSTDGVHLDSSPFRSQAGGLSFKLFGPSFTQTGSPNPTVYYTDVIPLDYGSGLTLTGTLADYASVGSGVFQVKVAVTCWTLIPPTGAGTFSNSSGALTPSSFYAAMSIALSTSGCTAGQNVTYAIERDNTVGSNLAGNMVMFNPTLRYTSAY